MNIGRRMTDLDTFLAYAVALEDEAAERHDELADMMEVHNNPDVAATFRKLAEYSRLHAQEIRDHARGSNLPVLAPWDFAWATMEGPESIDIGQMNYLMTRARALRVAIANERRAHQFYLAVSQDSPDEDVQALAAEFAVEELGHLALLEEWLGRIGGPPDAAVFDTDPPNEPE